MDIPRKHHGLAYALLALVLVCLGWWIARCQLEHTIAECDARPTPSPSATLTR